MVSFTVALSLYSCAFITSVYVFWKIFENVRLIYYLLKLPKDKKSHPLLGNLTQLLGDDVYEIPCKTHQFGTPCTGFLEDEVKKQPNKAATVCGHLRLPIWRNKQLSMSSTLFKTIRKWSKDLGPLYNIYLTLLYQSVNISGAEEFERIVSTTKNIEKNPIYKLIHLWLEDGLLTSTGSKWHTRRKILTPAFHFSILQQFLTVFNEETKRLTDDLKKETENPFTNIVPYISQFTLYSITETAMGTGLNLENDEDKTFVSAIHDIGKIFVHRLFRPWLYFQFIFYNMIPLGRKEKRLVNTMHVFTNKIIRAKMNNFEKFDVSDENVYLKRKKLAFLDLLINAKVSNGSIDDQGIKEEVNTFMFEGQDTIAMSLCFTLMLLANYREFQDEIYQEIVKVLGDKKPEVNDLNELKLMERFIKESLRLYPSVPFIGRILEEDVFINGYLLPKNTIVNIHVFDILRNEKYWPDPDKFDPDRFLPENCVNRHPFAYCPFSAGPRNCIGQRFAMLEAKAVLCGILRNFILEPIDTPETITLVVDMVLRTQAGSIKVKFSPRTSDK